MAHAGAQGLHFHTGSGVHGRIGVAKPAGVEVGEIDSFLYPLPEGFVSGFGEQPAFVVGDDIAFRHPVFQQDIGQHIAHGDELVAETGLGGFHDGFCQRKNDGPLYMDEGSFEVDILPAQAEHFLTV